MEKEKKNYRLGCLIILVSAALSLWGYIELFKLIALFIKTN